jgi:hypothetical protein
MQCLPVPGLLARTVSPGPVHRQSCSAYHFWLDSSLRYVSQTVHAPSSNAYQCLASMVRTVSPGTVHREIRHRHAVPASACRLSRTVHRQNRYRHAVPGYHFLGGWLVLSLRYFLQTVQPLSCIAYQCLADWLEPSLQYGTYRHTRHCHAVPTSAWLAG